jgi:hypothetical protein
VVAKMHNTTHVEHPPRLDDHRANGYNRSLGLAYGRVKGRWMNGLRLVRAAASAGHGHRWSIVTTGEVSLTQDGSRVVSVDTPSCNPTEKSSIYVRVRTSTYTDDFSQGDAKTSINTQPESTLDGSEAIGEPTLALTRSRSYPAYPSYPPADADPLGPLLHLCADVPPRICPDCDAEEELTLSGFLLACRSCHPNTFV